jgi:hypothetical protein
MHTKNLYIIFMPARTLSHRGFIRSGAEPQAERGPPMADLITILSGAAIFALLILYVPGCEHV